MKTNRKFQIQPRRRQRPLNVFAGVLLALACFAPAGRAANYYFDVNDVTPGFGTPSGNYLVNGLFWSTDATGSSTAVAFPTGGNAMIFGAATLDFTGTGPFIFSIDTSSLGGSSSKDNGITINSPDSQITLTNGGNFYLNSGTTTFSVATGSTLIEDITWNGEGMNANAHTLNLTGGGTIEFDTYLGYNKVSPVTQNGPTVNLKYVKSVASQTDTGKYFNGGYTLTSGRLNFANANSADVFSHFTTGTAFFSINGGTIDNTSGSALALTIGSDGCKIGGSFTFAGSSDLNFGTAAVTLTATPTITVNAHTLTLGGVISDGGSGYAIVKSGNGTLALTGANTYTNNTTVSAGKLAVTTAAAGGGNYTVTNGSTLDVQVAAAGQMLNVNTLTLGADGADACSLQVDAGALGNPTAPVINATNLAVNGTVTVNLFGSALTAGTYTILTYPPGARSGGGTFTLSTSPRINATLTDDTANNRVTVTINATPDSAIVWDGSASGNWDINDAGNLTWKGNNSGTATDYLEDLVNGNDVVRFDDAATGTTSVNLTTVLSPQGLTVSNTLATATASYTFTGSGSLSGTTGLTKQGSGALTLAETGGDNFSGGLTVNGGTLLLDNASSAIVGNTTIGTGAILQVGNNDANGSLPGTVTDNGALIFSRSDDALNLSGVISGAGAVTNNGSGTVTLSAVEMFTGPTVVNAGVLALAAGNHSPSTLSSSSSLTINSGGTVQVNIDNSLAGSGGNLGILPVTINAGGVLTGLGTADSGAGTSSHIRGLLTLNGGTLAMGGTSSQPTYGTWDLDDGVAVNGGTATSTISALDVIPSQTGGTIFDVAAGGTPGGIDLNVTGAFINGGSTHDTGIIKMGAGTMALAGANTYAGNTVISNGVLALVGSGSLASPEIAVTNGAIFDVSQLTSTFYLNSPQTLGGNGVVTGNVATVGSDLIDASLYGGSTLSFSNNLTLGYNTTCRFALDTTTSGANSRIAVAGTLDLTAGGIVVQINYTTLQTGRYKLFTYGTLAGGAADLTLSGYIAGGRQTAVLDDTIPGEIDLVVNGFVGNLTWQGNGGNNNWDVDTTQDWSNNVTHASDFYFDGDLVTFDDFGLQNPVVNLPGTVQPSLITAANNTGTYLITDAGAGKISGPTALVKLGAGTLILADSGGDDFSGGIVAGGGSLILSNNNVNISGGVTVTNGSVTLMQNGTISGGLTMDNSAGGSPAAQIVGYGSLNGDITAVGSLTISNSPSILGNLAVNSGNTLLDEDSVPAGNATLASGATLQVGNNDYSGNLPSGTVTMNGTLVFNRQDDILASSVIAGADSGNLVKSNWDTVTLSGANTFTGAVAVVSGVLKAGNARALGSTNVGTTISAGATLDVNGFNLGGEPVTVSGIGMTNSDGSTNGAINNSGGTAIYPALAFVKLAGDTIFGATVSRWDLGSPAGPAGDVSLSRLDTGGQPYKLTKVGMQWFGLRGVTVDPALGDVDVQAGIFNIEGNTTGLGNSASNLFVRSGAVLEFYNMTNQLNKQIKLDDGATIISGAGTNTVIGPVTLNGSVTVSNVSPLILTGTLSGTGSLTKGGASTLTLASPNNNYAGDTMINLGTLALGGAGMLPGAGQITLNGGALDVSQKGGGFTLTPNTVTANAGSELIASNSAPASIGTLNLNDSALQLVVADGGLACLNVTNLNFGGGSNFVNVIVQGTPAQTEFPLIKYAAMSGLNMGVSNVLPAVAGYIGYVTNNVANSSIDFVLNGSGATAVWNGGNSAVDNNWSDALNWSGTPLQLGNNLAFGGLAGLNNTNDTPAGSTYSGITFMNSAGAFVLNGNPITLTGNITNNSLNPQTVNLGLSISASTTFNGASNTLVLGGGLTNTAASGIATITLAGNGILTNLLASTTGTGTNIFAENTTNDNWTMVDSGTAITLPAASFNIAGGSTFNFGTPDSAPNLTVTGGSGTDNTLGNGTGTSTFNMVNGTLTLPVRLNTTASGNLNVSGGTMNVANQMQIANSSGTDVGVITVTGGTLNIGTVASPGSSTFDLASRGTGTLTIGGGLVECGTMDMSRNIISGTKAIINLNGGVLQATRVGNATHNASTVAGGATATFNFNGGTLRAGASSATFFQGSIVDPIIPITSIVRAGGAVIDTAGYDDGFLEPLQHDSGLGATPDGGLTKLGAGTLTLAAASTYTGNTLISAGTLEVDGSIGAGAVTVAATGTLSGAGTVGGTVTASGTLAPGTPSAAGLLTCSADVTLNGTNAMKLDKDNLTNDVLSVGGTLTYGGTLNVSFLTGTPALNDSFKLFSAASYSGSFTSVVPATPGSGLAWDTSTLTTDGTLRIVTGTSSNPTNITATVTGTTLTLTWPADHTGWTLQCQTNALGGGLNPGAGAWFDVPGSTSVNTVNIPIDSMQPTVFYRLKL